MTQAERDIRRKLAVLQQEGCDLRQSLRFSTTGRAGTLPALLLLVLAVAPGGASAQAPGTATPGDGPLVPEWVLHGVPVRVRLLRAPDRTLGGAAGPGCLQGSLLGATPDSLWLQCPKTTVSAGFGRAELQRVDVSLGQGHATGRGALIGLGAGLLLGLLGTQLIGEAETDGVLPAWGVIAGPFLGAIVGSCIPVEKWETTWQAGWGE